MSDLIISTHLNPILKEDFALKIRNPSVLVLEGSLKNRTGEVIFIGERKIGFTLDKGLDSGTYVEMEPSSLRLLERAWTIGDRVRFTENLTIGDSVTMEIQLKGFNGTITAISDDGPFISVSIDRQTPAIPGSIVSVQLSNFALCNCCQMINENE